MIKQSVQGGFFCLFVLFCFVLLSSGCRCPKSNLSHNLAKAMPAAIDAVGVRERRMAKDEINLKI